MPPPARLLHHFSAHYPACAARIPSYRRVAAGAAGAVPPAIPAGRPECARYARRRSASSRSACA